MRRNGYIEDLFARGGPFTGRDRSHGRVTVEKDFFLTEADVSGKYFSNLANEFHVDRRNPVRWWQRRDNSQVETEIPNVISIDRDSSMSQDAAACTIKLINTQMKRNLESRSDAQVKTGDLGDRGSLGFNYGEHAYHVDRWKHATNEWHRVLQPGVLLRTYEGYGGHDKTLDEALVDGNLMLTGAWIVDDVTMGSDGGMELKCRDVAALLIDQIMYPPLVPDACYPTQFYKDSETSFNYKDISSIVMLLCLWSGFWLKHSDNQVRVFGNIEQTGFVPESPIGADFFDKRTVIDVINQLKEYVGYITWIDQEGAFHFESPNYWQKGNFLYNGQHVDDIFVLDEDKNLMNYSVNISKKNDRSHVYVASTNPELDIPGTKFVRHTWPPANPGETSGTYLKGMQQPMIVGVEVDVEQSAMNIMAQLIHLYMWFARRTGSATIPGNPLIDINDQIKINERVTSESFYHYVRSVRSSHNLQTGVWTMDLGTNWLGTANDWAIVADGDWNIKYADGKMFVSSDAYGPYRGQKAIGRKSA